ncbi:E3 binding domain-containing protein [Deinococcus sp. S9]|uniref:E3 binding domain-containing protein n=1 Tax=Deinococcus sp. S9 TaxID=2545754 RepID=UPI0010545707|nr:E3 binding domain-containing protein [Deinococcus sp. S9]TDE86350.1 hypothetical protein E0686_06640 [Deinococcus sp. S9]
MERIAPLAKILAEANGIDWRNLPGSGEGGMIVEQDILNYLTRVMSGEEEPPPTPVDAPPPEWTGTELPAGAGLFGPGMPSADMLSSAGVDSDLAALVGQPQPVQQATAPSAEDDALEFELEDEETALPAAAAPSAAAPASAPATVAASVPEVVPAVPQPEPVAAQAETSAPAAAAAGGGVMAGLGSLLSRLYQPSAAQPPAQPAPVQPAPAAPEVPAAQVPVPPQPEVVAPEILPVAEAEAPTERVPAPPVEDAAPAAPQIAEEQTPEPATAPLPAAEARPREAVWFGTYLRRDANLAPATELRRQLIAALGQDVPLGLLVARAAQRHADRLGLNTVAVQDLEANRSLTAQPGGLRDALAALERVHEGTPDLLVLDAGTLDLDDLHLPHTLTLSVGRVQEGRAALTLQGDVDPTQAARFLAEVARTLEEPILLVL